VSDEFSLEFSDITKDSIPELIVNNAHDTITIYDITTRTALRDIIVKNSSFIKILGVGHYFNSDSELLVYSTYNLTSNLRSRALYVINAITGKIVWNFSFNSDEGLAPVYLWSENKAIYDENHRNLIIFAERYENRSSPDYVFGLSIDSKMRVWNISIPGFISSYTVLTKEENASYTTSDKKFLVIWSHNGSRYIPGEEPEYMYMLYCVDLENGALRWEKGPYVYQVRDTETYLAVPSLLSGRKSDFNNDGFEDLIIADSSYIYVIDGYTGSIIRSIPFSNLRLAVVDDFDNDGKFELIAESQNGTLIAFSLPDGKELWEIKISLDKLNQANRLFTVPIDSNNSLKDILVLRNDTYILIDPIKGTIIFEKDVLNELNALGISDALANSNSDSIKEYLLYEWTEPVITDLNSDGKNEIVVSVYSEEFGLREDVSNLSIYQGKNHKVSFRKSEENTSINHTCVLLTLDTQTGKVIDFLNLSDYGIAYIYGFKTYKVVTQSSVFIFLRTWSVLNDDLQAVVRPYNITVIKFQ